MKSLYIRSELYILTRHISRYIIDMPLNCSICEFNKTLDVAIMKLGLSIKGFSVRINEIRFSFPPSPQWRNMHPLMKEIHLKSFLCQNNYIISSSISVSERPLPYFRSSDSIVLAAPLLFDAGTWRFTWKDPFLIGSTGSVIKDCCLM